MAFVSTGFSPLQLQFSSLQLSSFLDDQWGLGIVRSRLFDGGIGLNNENYRLRYCLAGGETLRYRCFQRRASVRAVGDSSSSHDGVSRDRTVKSLVDSIPVGRFREIVGMLPPVLGTLKHRISGNVSVTFAVLIAFVVIVVRAVISRQESHGNHGTVSDLIRRGQLKSDRRGISKPLKYDDPFDNPLVKTNKNNSTVKMCGKVYKLAPVTLTEEQQTVHQRRRMRAYQWKRPTVFLKEGESIPPDVDPETVRWIPANHPFATTVSDIDEELAQNNVYQKRGVPFRIRAEHEALQKKVDALSNEGKLTQLSIDPGSIKSLERPFESFSPQEPSDSTLSSGYGQGQSLDSDTSSEK